MTQPPEPTEPVAEPDRPRIPEGDYNAEVIRVRLVPTPWGREDLGLWFEILDGEFAGTILPMHIPYYGRKTVSHSTKLYEQWKLAIGRSPRKGEVFAKKVFRNGRFVVSVRGTARKFEDGSVKPSLLQYSKVDTIKKRIDEYGDTA